MKNTETAKNTATAHLEWDKRWQTKEGRADWLTPEHDVVQFTESLGSASKNLRVLDLGCGVGRHAMYLAEQGFETYGLDGSEAGLSYAKQIASERNLTLQLTHGSMEALPYEDEFFDYILAFNVIYHGDPTVVSRCVAEIHRVLRSGGFFQGTMLSKRNGKYGRGREIAPNTFVIPNEDDKDHPHFYCNALELCQLLNGFELRSLKDQIHKKPESWHWHLIAERL